MNLNDVGILLGNEWLKLPERFENILLHDYVVMPNHVHAIIEIVGATLVVAQNDDYNQNNTNKQKGQTQGIAPYGCKKNKTIGEYTCLQMWYKSDQIALL